MSRLIPDRPSAEPPPVLLSQLFPWLEGELEALITRQRGHRHSQDVALQHFLHLLVWLRVVLLQDAAILYTKYPDANIFTYPPFNTPVFHAFAASSTARIDEIEEAARLAFKNCPETLARGLRGAIAAVQLENQKGSDVINARFDALLEELQHMSGDTRQARGSHRSYKTTLNVMSAPPPPPPPIGQPSAQNLPNTWPMSGSPNGPGMPNTPSAIPQAATPTTTPALHVPHSERTGVGSPAVPLSDVANLSLPELVAQGSVPGHEPPLGAFAQCVVSHYSDAQLSSWDSLIRQFGDFKLRNHTPEWIGSAQTWLPFYRFQPVMKIADIWTEFDEGLNGFLPVPDLNTTWGAKWRRNIAGLKTEAARRNKVVELVEKLAKQPHWDVACALQFIQDQYEGKMTPRAFCDFLQANRGAGITSALRAAESYVVPV